MGIFSKKLKNSDGVDVNMPILSEHTSFDVSEAYKSLRTNLIFSIPGSECKKILLTSTTKGEGKSTVAVNLAITLAENGSRVFLMDCDLRLSYLAKALNIKQAKGLSDVIIGNYELSRGIVKLRNNLWFLPAGTVPPNPSELLGTNRMAKIMAEVEKNFDFVIVDAPPIGIVADPLVLSPLVDGFIMVVRKNMAKKDEIDRCIRNMKKSGTKMLGFIMTTQDGSSRNSKTYNKYGYEYYRKK